MWVLGGRFGALLAIFLSSWPFAGNENPQVASAPRCFLVRSENPLTWLIPPGADAESKKSELSGLPAAKLLVLQIFLLLGSWAQFLRSGAGAWKVYSR